MLDMSPEDKFPLAYKTIRDSITVKGAHPGKSLERDLIVNIVTTQHTAGGTEDSVYLPAL